jgi:UDPglucose--hexose-1-phosphate uridylyltransferase
MRKWTLRRQDGRELYFYSQAQPPGTYLGEGEPAPQLNSHLRWHPLRQEWVIYAAHRQGRTFLPPKEFCPLCPSRPEGWITEVPWSDFEVVVFQNRFPALVPEAPEPPHLMVPTAPARGVCEVVVYTPEHSGSLATLSAERRELLLEVWVDRYRELLAQEEIAFVMPFENRGAQVGVTLHHPHGQIYAYPFVPPVLQQEAQSFRRHPVLLDLVPHLGPYRVEADEHVVSFVPPFARYPFELWLAPLRFHPGPWTMSPAERASLARQLGEAVARYDRLFGSPLPYILVLHAAPKGEEEFFHFHLEFYPALRAPDRLKYLAGTEVGAGTFTADLLPEEMAEQLRGVEVPR